MEKHITFKAVWQKEYRRYRIETTGGKIGSVVHSKKNADELVKMLNDMKLPTNYDALYEAGEIMEDFLDSVCDTPEGGYLI